MIHYTIRVHTPGNSPPLYKSFTDWNKVGEELEILHKEYPDADISVRRMKS